MFTSAVAENAPWTSPKMAPSAQPLRPIAVNSP
jgi:hypothetical protein